MATAINYPNPLNGLLQSLLGEGKDVEQTTNQNSTATNTQTGQQSGTSSQTTNQTGNTNTTTTGNQSTVGNSSQTTTSIAKTMADVSKLEQVFAKQAAGVTPEMLAAIFQEGSKSVPTLTNAYASAVGARSSGNAPLGLALKDMQVDLTNKAAQLNTTLLQQSGDTAAKIAELTKQMTQTNETSGQQTQNVNTSQNQAVEQIMKQLLSGSTNQTSSQNNTSNTTTNEKTSADANTTLNPDVLKLMAGLGLGGYGLDQVLQGAGMGGLGGLGGLISGGLQSAGGWLKELFNPSDVISPEIINQWQNGTWGMDDGVPDGFDSFTGQQADPFDLFWS